MKQMATSHESLIKLTSQTVPRNNRSKYGFDTMNHRQEHVLHSIGQLFSSADDEDADSNEVDRAAVVGHTSLGGDDDEGNLDLSNPLRVVL